MIVLGPLASVEDRVMFEEGDKIREALRKWITEYAGERCEEVFVPDGPNCAPCCVCEAWKAFDVIFGSLDEDARVLTN